MTDKQIIIDGVDVSGCNRLNIFPMQYGEPHEICLTSLEQWGGQEKYCKDRPNCYYKQLEKLKAENLGFKILHESDKDLLKRKEQECEELKRQRQSDKGLITSTGKMNYQLLQEYDKLKTENDNIKETFDGLFKVQYKLADNNKKLRQCLTEIKEIAENAAKCLYVTMSDDYTDGYRWLGSIILQKISECEANQ